MVWTKAWPAARTRADRNVLKPRIGARQALTRPWCAPIVLFACCSESCTAVGTSSSRARAFAGSPRAARSARRVRNATLPNPTADIEAVNPGPPSGVQGQRPPSGKPWSQASTSGRPSAPQFETRFDAMIRGGFGSSDSRGRLEFQSRKPPSRLVNAGAPTPRSAARVDRRSLSRESR